MNSLNKSSEILLAEMTSEDVIRKELDDVTLYFDYQETDTETELSLITISKNHGERFLFHKTSSNSKLSCLSKMIDYIKSDYKKNFQNYEIVWRKKGDVKDMSQQAIGLICYSRDGRTVHTSVGLQSRFLG